MSRKAALPEHLPKLIAVPPLIDASDEILAEVAQRTKAAASETSNYFVPEPIGRETLRERLLRARE